MQAAFEGLINQRSINKTGSEITEQGKTDICINNNTRDLIQEKGDTEGGRRSKELGIELNAHKNNKLSK